MTSIERFCELPTHGKKILLLLENKKKNQRWLAEECYSTKSHICNIINGNALPSIRMAFRICKALDSSIEVIFKDLV